MWSFLGVSLRKRSLRSVSGTRCFRDIFDVPSENVIEKFATYYPLWSNGALKMPESQESSDGKQSNTAEGAAAPSTCYSDPSFRFSGVEIAVRTGKLFIDGDSRKPSRILLSIQIVILC